MKPRSSVPLCRECSQPLAASATSCPSCGQPTTPAPLRELGAQLMRELGRELGESPYLRGSGGLSYTLQGHTWGFLEDSDHPLGRAILWALFRLTVQSESADLPFVFHHAIHRCLRPEYPKLARAVDYLRKRLARQWEELCASGEAQAFRGAADSASSSASPKAEGGREAVREAEVREWFERWRLSPAFLARDGGSRPAPRGGSRWKR